MANEKNAKPEKPKKGLLGKTFDLAKDEAREISGELTEELRETREQTAEFLERHGQQSRLKVAAATAFKAELFKVWASSALRTGATKLGTSSALAAKVGLFTAPVAKFTMPIVFTGAFIFGPRILKKAAEIIRGANIANDNPTPAEDANPKAANEPETAKEATPCIAPPPPPPADIKP